MLGYAWNEADRLAGSFEHDLPQEVEDRIFQALDRPATCPHGFPIPEPADRGHPGHAAALRPRAGRRGRGGRARARSTRRCSTFLDTLGVRPGVIVEVKEKHPFDGPLVVRGRRPRPHPQRAGRQPGLRAQEVEVGSPPRRRLSAARAYGRAVGLESERRREEEHRPAPLPFLPGEVSNGEFLPAGADRPRPRHRRGGPGPRVRRGRPARASTGAGSSRPRAAWRRCSARSTSSPAAGGGSSRGPRGPRRPRPPPGPRPRPAPSRCPNPRTTEACEHALGDQGEFIFDVHTHHVMPDRPWQQNAPRILDMIRGLAPGRRAPRPSRSSAWTGSPTCTTCSSPATRPSRCCPTCPTRARTTRRCRSTTRSAPPTSPTQLAEGGEPRVLVHNVIAPNFGPLQARLDDMAAPAATGKVAAFKVYTAWGPGRQGYSMLDPAIGIPVVEQARVARGEGALRAQGPAAARVRPSLQRSRGHGRRWPPATPT